MRASSETTAGSLMAAAAMDRGRGYARRARGDDPGLGRKARRGGTLLTPAGRPPPATTIGAPGEPAAERPRAAEKFAGNRSIKPGLCNVCRHPERARIEAMVCGGAAQLIVGKQFGLTKDTMSRHFKNHVTPQRRAELVAGPAKVQDLVNAAADESKGLLEYFQITRSVLFNQFLAAAEAGDRQGVSLIATRLLAALDRLGRLTGELREVSGITVNNNIVNLFASPEFLALQRGLLDLARKHPGARGDIVQLLRGLDAKPACGLPAKGDAAASAGVCGLPGPSDGALVIDGEAVDAA